MKTHKTVKKLLKQGYNKIKMENNNICVTIEHTMTGENFRTFHDDYSEAYYLDICSGIGEIIIKLTKI